jgi:hypothetical protein
MLNIKGTTCGPCHEKRKWSDCHPYLAPCVLDQFPAKATYIDNDEETLSAQIGL